MTDWLVTRIEFWKLTPDQRAEMLVWLRGLGVEPENCLATAVLTDTGGGFRLHLAELVRNEDGKVVSNLVQGGPATRPVILPVSAEGMPGWIRSLLPVTSCPSS